MKTEKAIKVGLILWFIIAMYIQHNVGLADNDDFSRSANWISSGPIGLESADLTVGSENWFRRFDHYWIPYWKFEPRMVVPPTSAFLIWLPGVLLNRFLYSNQVLDIAILSLFPKLILFLVLMALFYWIQKSTKNINHRILYLITLGLPVTLILTDTNYVAYFNSFYMESASFVFLFLILVSLLLLKRSPSHGYLIFSLVCIVLLSSNKRAYAYWPLLSVPFIFYVWAADHKIRSSSMILIVIATIILFGLVSRFITRDGLVFVNRYHSLFYGVLAFSNNPSKHLEHLEIADASECVDTFYWSSTKGQLCLKKYRNKMSFSNTVKVIYREPAVMLKMMKYVLDRMQDVSLCYLGKYSFSDPRSRTSPAAGGMTSKENRYQSCSVETTPLNLWSRLKFNLFPTGTTLAFTLGFFLIWFTSRLNSPNIRQDLALVGLIFSLACIVDMMVAILGDGKFELMKHLFLSNVLFDLAAVLFLNSLLACWLELGDGKGPDS